MEDGSKGRCATSSVCEITQGGSQHSALEGGAQIINTLMYQCEVKNCHFEHVKVGGTTVCTAPYVSPEAAEIMAEIRRARQDYRLAPFNLPQRNRVFAGRDDELSQLTTCFAQSDNDTNATELVILGKGGVGKSQLAIAYAQDKVESVETFCTSTDDECVYNYVIYFQGSLERLSHDIHLLARAVGFAFEKKEPARVVAMAVYRLLSHLPRVLFIIDGLNCWEDGLEALLPPRNTSSFHCLYTSKERSVWETTLGMPYRKFELDVFDEAGVLDYFYKAADDLLKAQANSETDWLALAGPDKRLGGLPLALAQAMAYLKKIKTSTIQQYLEQFNKRFAIFASHPPQDDYRYTVLTAWMMTLPKLLVLSSNATELFFAMAYLQGNAIPRGIIDSYYASREGWSELDVAGVSMDISHLVDYSLINELDEENIQIHQLLQESIIWWLSRRSKEMHRAKSSSTPKKVVAHQAQLEVIAKQIGQAAERGCQTNPYQLICTMGEASYKYNNALWEKKFLTLSCPDHPLLGHVHSLVRHLLQQPTFQNYAKSSMDDGVSKPLNADHRLVALFFIALLCRITTNSISTLGLYIEVLDNIAEVYTTLYGRALLEIVCAFLSKLSPTSLPSVALLQWGTRCLKSLLNQEAVIDAVRIKFQPIQSALDALIETEPDQKYETMKMVVSCCPGKKCWDSLSSALLVPQYPPIIEYFDALIQEENERYTREDTETVTLPGDPDFENLVVRIAQQYGISSEQAKLFQLIELNDSLVLPHISQVGMESLRVYIFAHWLRHYEMNWVHAITHTTTGSTQMIDLYQKVVPIGSALDTEGTQEVLPSNINLELVMQIYHSRFGSVFAKFYSSDGQPDDAELASQAAILAIGSGFYDLLRHYVMRALNATTHPLQAQAREYHLPLLYFCNEVLDGDSVMPNEGGIGEWAEGAIAPIPTALYNVFRAYHLFMIRKYDEAIVSLEATYQRPSIHITFNCWCVPHEMPWISQYLKEARNQIQNADTPYFPVLVFSTRQFAALLSLHCKLARDDEGEQKKEVLDGFSILRDKLGLAPNPKPRASNTFSGLLESIRSAIPKVYDELEVSHMLDLLYTDNDSCRMQKHFLSFVRVSLQEQFPDLIPTTPDNSEAYQREDSPVSSDSFDMLFLPSNEDDESNQKEVRCRSEDEEHSYVEHDSGSTEYNHTGPDSVICCALI